MDPKELRGLMEAYSEVYAPIDENRMASRMEKMPSAPAKVGKETHSTKDLVPSKEPTPEEKAKARKALGLGEATAMAKRGKDETAIRNKIASSTGGGQSADRAGALADRPTYGQSGTDPKARANYARKQMGDFRKTNSSNPGLKGYAYKSNDPDVKAKQAARGAQRGSATLTPNEKKQLNMGEAVDLFDTVLEFLQAEGYAETLEEAEWLMANVIDEEAIDIILDEAEGSYGQTPNARQRMGALAIKRRNTPASEYSERGEKKKKVDSASRHFNRMGNPDAGNKGKKSSRPYYPAGRKGMTQKDRDWSRGADEYGHSGYDGEGGGGSLPKGKKLERQRKTGVSEAQEARNNPDKYEREQSKKSAPVRGERTPMPPRGDKRREDFEKWYAANVR